LVVAVWREIDEIFVEADFEDAAYDVGTAAFAHRTPRFEPPGPYFAFRARQKLVGDPLAFETAKVLIRLVG
jgi:hypothetical protein